MIGVFDGHNDVLFADDWAAFETGRPEGHVDLPGMRAGGLRAGNFAIFTPSASRGAPIDHAVAASHATMASGRLLGWERAGLLRVARSLADLDAAFAGTAVGPVSGIDEGVPGAPAGAGSGPVAVADTGPPAAVMHLEGAEAIDAGLEALDHWYAAGLRSLGPVWSRVNAFATGVQLGGDDPDVGPGLTDAGRALVRACAELGIVVDVSHLNAAGFWDLAALEAGPIVASHSGVHQLCRSARNLTDRQLDAIAASDGLVGIVFGGAFTRADREDEIDTPLTLIAEHARYVADRVGVRHVALGSDFDGMPMPRGLRAATLPLLLDTLREAGFTDAELAAIAWGNWRRVISAWWR